MKIFRTTLGNILTDKDVADSLRGYAIERLRLDPYIAQKSRFTFKSESGTECGVALPRNQQLADGDVLAIDPVGRTALVATISMAPVFVIDLDEVAKLDREQAMRTCIELGHAIGNQHWPAVVKGKRVYVPLTVDCKVMQSVMDTHAIPGIAYHFEESNAVLPHLSPGEVRQLLGGRCHHLHNHGHDAAS